MIGVPREEASAHAMQGVERKPGGEINYTVVTRKEFESPRARKDAFLKNVWHNKPVALIGSNDEAQAAHG